MSVLLSTDGTAADAKRRRCVALLLRVCSLCVVRYDPTTHDAVRVCVCVVRRARDVLR